MYIKSFNEWNISKQNLDKKALNLKSSIRAGEIRWVSLGVNIGREIDGKGKSFSRPCLIYKKVGRELFFIIPITSKDKNLFGYFPITIKDKQNTLCLLHARSISENRILERMSKISDKKLLDIKNEIEKFFLK